MYVFYVKENELDYIFCLLSWLVALLMNECKVYILTSIRQQS